MAHRTENSPAAPAPKPSKLFTALKIHVVPPLVEFRMKEVFRAGQTTRGIKMAPPSATFSDFFLIKVEEPPLMVATIVFEQTLRVRVATDQPRSGTEPGTLAALGGFTQAETTFGQVFEVLAGLTKADRKKVYVSYHSDYEEDLRAIWWRWDGGYLVPDTLPINRKDKHPWNKGDVFLSSGGIFTPSDDEDRIISPSKSARAA